MSKNSTESCNLWVNDSPQRAIDNHAKLLAATNSSVLYYELGNMLLQEKRLVEAVQSYRRCVEFADERETRELCFQGIANVQDQQQHHEGVISTTFEMSATTPKWLLAKAFTLLKLRDVVGSFEVLQAPGRFTTLAGAAAKGVLFRSYTCGLAVAHYLNGTYELSGDALVQCANQSRNRTTQSVLQVLHQCAASASRKARNNTAALLALEPAVAAEVARNAPGYLDSVLMRSRMLVGTPCTCSRVYVYRRCNCCCVTRGQCSISEL